MLFLVFKDWLVCFIQSHTKNKLRENGLLCVRQKTFFPFYMYMIMGFHQVKVPLITYFS